jgi:hypothetical protein
MSKDTGWRKDGLNPYTVIRNFRESMQKALLSISNDQTLEKSITNRLLKSRSRMVYTSLESFKNSKRRTIEKRKIKMKSFKNKRFPVHIKIQLRHLKLMRSNNEKASLFF